jgi:hypothetical protein
MLCSAAGSEFPLPTRRLASGLEGSNICKGKNSLTAQTAATLRRILRRLAAEKHFVGQGETTAGMQAFKNV